MQVQGHVQARVNGNEFVVDVFHINQPSRVGLPGRAPHLIGELVVHQREEPGAQVGARRPQAPFAAGPLERVLHQVVGGPGIAREHTGVAPQSRNLGNELRAIHGLRRALPGSGR